MAADHSFEISSNITGVDDFNDVGMFLGMVLSKKVTIPLYFSVPMLKQLLGIDVEFDDLRAVDPLLYGNFQWILYWRLSI
jgi:hypothetical protein